MEVVSSSVAILVWEYALKPVVDSIKKEYGNETKKLLKSLVHNILEKEKIEPKELDIIEAEIINAPADVLSDKEKFLEFVRSNENIKDEYKVNITINGDVKGVVNAQSGSVVNQTIS